MKLTISGSGDIFTGISALHCDAWNNSSDCKHPRTWDGWGPCKPSFILWFTNRSLPFILKSMYYCKSKIVALVIVEQSDKAHVIQTLLFMSGINTLLQTLIGSRLRAVMSASFAFTIPVMSIIDDYTDRTFPTQHEVCIFQLAYNSFYASPF